MNNYKLGTILSCFIILALAGGVLAAQETDNALFVDEARDTVSRWIETQRIIAEERSDWEQGREMLKERVTLLESERDKLAAKLDEFRGQIGEANTKGREAGETEQSLASKRAYLESSITRLERRTLALTAYLPAAVRTKIDPLVRRIPAGDGETERTLGERYQSVVGVLSEMNRFNQEVSVYNELQELPDGSMAEVQTIYFGLGQAYYSTDDGTMAGVGVPGTEGWIWKSVDDLGPAVLKTAAVLNGQDVPGYVPLPVEVR